jgi:uncharacterized membrane protein
MQKTRSFIQQLQQFFLTTLIGGVVVVLPLALLVMLVRFIWGFMTTLLSPLRGIFPIPGHVESWLLDIISLMVVLLAFFLIGLFVRTSIGGRFFKSLEARFLDPLPLYATLRSTVQQFAGLKKMPFSEVVLVDAFGNGALMTGFVIEEISDNLLTVFVPTAPNPTNGFVFHLHKDRIRFVDSKTEEAMRTIIGMGTGSTALFQKIKP